MNEVTTGSSGFDITTAKAKIEQKFGRWTWVVGLIVAILLGPVFWAAAYAAAGAAALGATCVGIYLLIQGVVHTLPLITMKMKRLQIEAVIREATKYPIPTLLAQWEQDKAANVEMDNAVTREETAILNYEANVRKMRQGGLLSDVELKDYEDDIVLMKEGLVKDKEDYQGLLAQTAEFKRQIDKADGIWKLETERQAVNATMMSSRAQTALDHIARETEFDSILHAQAVSRAQLSQRMRNRVIGAKAAALTNDPAPAITQLGQVQDVSYVQKGKTS